MGRMWLALMVLLGVVAAVSPHQARDEDRDFSQFVDIPAGINEGLSYARPSTMDELLGAPCAKAVNCSPVTNARIAHHVITASVGPFRVSGLSHAVWALRRIFYRAGMDHTALVSASGTAGMLCCRLIRGSTTNMSNHSWGTTIDLLMEGQLDPRGDGKAQLGLLELYPFFHDEGFYWGAGFRYEDAMHYELADETIRNWSELGLLDYCSGRGTYSGGACTCNEGFSGADCSVATCPSDCSGKGLCNDLTARCECDRGWVGDDCARDANAPPPSPSPTPKPNGGAGTNTGAIVGGVLGVIFGVLLVVGIVFLVRNRKRGIRSILGGAPSPIRRPPTSWGWKKSKLQSTRAQGEDELLAGGGPPAPPPKPAHLGRYIPPTHG